jgi:acetyl-CoA acetyltransferase
MSSAVLIGAAEARYQRHPTQEVSTESLLVDAALQALDDAQLERSDIDGMAISSFTLSPDHAIDLAWRLGLKVRWLMEDTNGGASGVNMLQHAARAVEAGDATRVLILAGDRMGAAEFTRLANSYNVVTRDHLAPLPCNGPNTLFSFVTQRHMDLNGLTREDYGQIPVAQRSWAALNPGAAYRAPLSIQEYMEAPMVAPPLCRYDCVPLVSGADAVIVASADAITGGRYASVRAVVASYNADHQEGDGQRTGLTDVASALWEAAGCGPEDIDLASVYDDYPVVVLVLLNDLGMIEGGDLPRFLHHRLGAERWPLNTSGGMLSSGQAGAAGGLHGLVEAVNQLRGLAGARQIPARHALVVGYGMVLANYGACANAVVLEGSG